MPREMKDSGIEWIGNIPCDWKVLKLQYACDAITDYTASGSFADLAANVTYLDDEDYAMLVRTADLSAKREIGRVYIDKHAYDYLRNSNLYGGEIILPNIGSVGNVYYYVPMYKHATLAPNAIMLRTKNNRYLYYLFMTTPAEKALNRLSNATTQAKFNKTQLRKMKVILPDGNTQDRIVSFLDAKCAEIDALSADIQKQIEKLEEYKRSVITEAVTKGLDPNVEMKDSGIEFIGSIPKCWKVIRIKNVGTYRNGLTYSPQDICDEGEGILVLRSSNVKEGGLVLDDNVYVNCPIPKDLMVQKNDILICSRNGSRELIGKNALLPSINATFGAFMMIFRCNTPVYMYYVLNSTIFSYYLGSFFTSTINQLTGRNFGDMKIPFCPMAEDRERIVSFLDKKCEQIDNAITEKREQLSILEAYKKSIIYEYVTGKKEVPADE